MQDSDNAYSFVNDVVGETVLPGENTDTQGEHARKVLNPTGN